MIETAPLVTVDLRAPGAPGKVREAGRAIGAFYLAGHGVSGALIDAHFDLAREFFALDDAVKYAIAVRPGAAFRGYEPLGTQTIDADAPGDLKEGFIMGPDLPPDHLHVLAAYPNTGTNRWPSMPLHFRAQMEAWVEAMAHVGRGLAHLLAQSLDLPAGFFDPALREPLVYTQLFRYPSLACASASARGAGAHFDWGMLTILAQDDVGGLEIRDPACVWHPVPPIAGTFVIILGELMVRYTGGAYRSPMHRVTRNTSGRDRYSMPAFFDPGYDEVVECVPTCLPERGEPRFPARTVVEHMREMRHHLLSHSC